MLGGDVVHELTKRLRLAFEGHLARDAAVSGEVDESVGVTEDLNRALKSFHSVVRLATQPDHMEFCDQNGG